MASYNLGKVVGDDGVSLEYDWEGTSLGIKRDDEEEYTYVDLKGDKGDTGSTGASGSDGYSPTVQTSKEGKTTTIEITDKNGVHTATIQDGADGSNGVDGTSPTATVSKSGNTATITITDKNGTTTTSVSDGTNGTDGRDGYVQYTAGDNITIENNVISASGGGSTYFLTTPFTTATASTSLNADDIATLNKAIDDFRAEKDFVLIAKKMMFKTSGSITSYSYNVNGVVRGTGKNIYIDFYRNFGTGTSAWPINFDDASLTRTITLSNVGTPANITSASLPAQGTPSFSDNIITIGNTIEYNVNNNYNPAHKQYVDTKVATKQDIMQYETLPTASENNEGQIVQYIGTTTNDYTNGYFYQCVSDGEATPTYSWENIQVQEGSSGGSQSSFVFRYGETSATSIATAQQVIDYYNNYGVFPTIYYTSTNNSSYAAYNSYYSVRLNGYTASSRRYEFQVYKIVGVSSQYSGGNTLGCYGKIYIILNSDNLTVSSVTLPNSSYTSNNQVRDYTIPILYKRGNAMSSIQSYLDADSVLPINNSEAFTPTGNYNPATKKYVDDSIASAITDALGGNY